MGHIECWFDDGEYSNGTGTTYNIKYILPKYWKHNVSKINSKSQSVGNWFYLEFLKNFIPYEHCKSVQYSLNYYVVW